MKTKQTNKNEFFKLTNKYVYSKIWLSDKLATKSYSRPVNCKNLLAINQTDRNAIKAFIL